MSPLAPLVAAIPGPPLVTPTTDVAFAVASAAIALDVLAILGAIVLLVARSSCRPTIVRRPWWTFRATRVRRAHQLLVLQPGPRP
jgi:hypothetical protein